MDSLEDITRDFLEGQLIDTSLLRIRILKAEIGAQQVAIMFNSIPNDLKTPLKVIKTYLVRLRLEGYYKRTWKDTYTGIEV